jgi:hypothetical protein
VPGVYASHVTKKRRSSEAGLVREIAAAHEFVQQLKRDLRSPDPRVREHARRIKTEGDRLDREIAQALARKPR